MLFEICIICSIVFVLWIIGKLLMLFDMVYVPKKCVHIWRHALYLDQGVYCSICEIMLTSSGFYCEACGVCSDLLCIEIADKMLKCKETSIDLSKIKSSEPIVRDQEHLWVKGNLTQNYVCCICEREIDYHGRPGLYGYRCCWCQRCTHVNCFVRTVDSKVCDFGSFKNVIIPPNHVSVKHRRLQHITNIVPPIWPDWKPLIVVGNLKSGDSTAANVIATFRSVLNPIQVFELNSSGGPRDALRLTSKIPSVQCRILVAGGDGTIGWILKEIVRKNIQPIPEVSILPIGTGNDLSRVLNWGGVPPKKLNPTELCEKIENAEVVQLDRWLIDIKGQTSSRLNMNWLPHRKLHMYNYFSIGVDAQIALNFHKARDSPFHMTSSRIFNKLLRFNKTFMPKTAKLILATELCRTKQILYLCFGTQQVGLPDCVGLAKKLEVYLDDVNINLPELHGDENDLRYQSISDGVIEVIGIVSSFHMAQLQVGLNKPIRLGQGRNVRIILKDSFPVQADGEPWIQSQSQINISCHGQAKMLKCS